MLRLVGRVVRTATRLAGRSLRLAYRKCWQEPSEIKGTVWVISFWLRAAGLALALFRAPLALLLFAAGWGIARLQARQPKRTARPIPLRRHR
jgi:hypothetical protein